MALYSESIVETLLKQDPAQLFEELQTRLVQVVVDDETFWRVEGDYLLDYDQLLLYSEQRAALNVQQQARLARPTAGLGEVTLTDLLIEDQGRGLVGIVQNSRIVRWSPGTVLTYCVLSNTFPRREWYRQVVRNMERATADWEETCGVDFEYRSEFDESDQLRPSGVIFPVRLIDAGGQFIASAFFPNDPLSRRRLLIDPSYSSETLRFNPVGVLRHELGHTLGFRHEHIRSNAPPICPDEDVTGTLDLTAYDPRSVMHYFCGGVGSRELAITALDRSGSQRVYGLPFTNYQASCIEE
jgi:hypothetical protein